MIKDILIITKHLFDFTNLFLLIGNIFRLQGNHLQTRI
jgi:hypothetical protein